MNLTGWELPGNAEVLEHRNTHGGMTYDGDFTLTVRLQPDQLKSLLGSTNNEWVECPVDPDIARHIWEIPENTGTIPWGEKTSETDGDWHRGHVVIVNPDEGMIWIHEWKG
ncbi:MAG: hypothetical protein AB8G99_22655 [Planctomycetaceae bacterium]